MKKVKLRTAADFKHSATFQEDLALMKAQDIVSSLIEETETTQKQLARKLGVSQSQVSRLLEDGRNMTLRTFTKLCFFLGYEIGFGYRPLKTKSHWIFPFIKLEDMRPNYHVAPALKNGIPAQKIERPSADLWGDGRRLFSATGRTYQVVTQGGVPSRKEQTPCLS